MRLALQPPQYCHIIRCGPASLMVVVSAPIQSFHQQRQYHHSRSNQSQQGGGGGNFNNNNGGGGYRSHNQHGGGSRSHGGGAGSNTTDHTATNRFNGGKSPVNDGGGNKNTGQSMASNSGANSGGGYRNQQQYQGGNRASGGGGYRNNHFNHSGSSNHSNATSTQTQDTSAANHQPRGNYGNNNQQYKSGFNNNSNITNNRGAYQNGDRRNNNSNQSQSSSPTNTPNNNANNGNRGETSSPPAIDDANYHDFMSKRYAGSSSSRTATIGDASLSQFTPLSSLKAPSSSQHRKSASFQLPPPVASEWRSHPQVQDTIPFLREKINSRGIPYIVKTERDLLAKLVEVLMNNAPDSDAEAWDFVEAPPPLEAPAAVVGYERRVAGPMGVMCVTSVELATSMPGAASSTSTVTGALTGCLAPHRQPSVTAALLTAIKSLISLRTNFGAVVSDRCIVAAVIADVENTNTMNLFAPIRVLSAGGTPSAPFELLCRRDVISRTQETISADVADDANAKATTTAFPVSALDLLHIAVCQEHRVPLDPLVVRALGAMLGHILADLSPSGCASYIPCSRETEGPHRNHAQQATIERYLKPLLQVLEASGILVVPTAPDSSALPPAAYALKQALAFEHEEIGACGGGIDLVTHLEELTRGLRRNITKSAPQSTSPSTVDAIDVLLGSSALAASIRGPTPEGNTESGDSHSTEPAALTGAIKACNTTITLREQHQNILLLVAEIAVELASAALLDSVLHTVCAFYLRTSQPIPIAPTLQHLAGTLCAQPDDVFFLDRILSSIGFGYASVGWSSSIATHVARDVSKAAFLAAQGENGSHTAAVSAASESERLHGIDLVAAYLSHVTAQRSAELAAFVKSFMQQSIEDYVRGDDQSISMLPSAAQYWVIPLQKKDAIGPLIDTLQDDKGAAFVYPCELVAHHIDWNTQASAREFSRHIDTIRADVSALMVTSHHDLNVESSERVRESALEKERSEILFPLHAHFCAAPPETGDEATAEAVKSVSTDILDGFKRIAELTNASNDDSPKSHPIPHVVDGVHHPEVDAACGTLIGAYRGAFRTLISKGPFLCNPRSQAYILQHDLTSAKTEGSEDGEGEAPSSAVELTTTLLPEEEGLLADVTRVLFTTCLENAMVRVTEETSKFHPQSHRTADAVIAALQEAVDAHLIVVKRNVSRTRLEQLKEGHSSNKRDVNAVDIGALLVESPYAASDFISYLVHYSVIPQLLQFFTETLAPADAGGDCRPILLGAFVKLCISVDRLESELRALLELACRQRSPNAANSRQPEPSTLRAVSDNLRPLLVAVAREYGCEVADSEGSVKLPAPVAHIQINASTISPHIYSELFDETRRREDIELAQALRHLRTQLFWS